MSVTGSIKDGVDCYSAGLVTAALRKKRLTVGLRPSLKAVVRDSVSNFRERNEEFWLRFRRVTKTPVIAPLNGKPNADEIDVAILPGQQTRSTQY